MGNQNALRADSEAEGEVTDTFSLRWRLFRGYGLRLVIDRQSAEANHADHPELQLDETTPQTQSSDEVPFTPYANLTDGQCQFMPLISMGIGLQHGLNRRQKNCGQLSRAINPLKNTGFITAKNQPKKLYVVGA